jgi:hypothetical protein
MVKEAGMAELELEGLHPDGEHLILIGADGTTFRLPIDDALRAAVRRDRTHLEKLRSANHVSPREIQGRVRAGESAQDVADQAGVSLEYVLRYEGPVAAERSWVVEQALTIPIGRESGAPRLGDLVIDRLAARGVAPGDLAWTAVRRPGEAWELVLTFPAADRDREARWTVDLPSRSLHALDDEGRWLSEVELGGSAARRHLAAVRSRLYDVELDRDVITSITAVEVTPTGQVHDAEPDSPADRTADLLDELRASRGVRQPLERIDDADLWDDPPAAHPPASMPQEARDASILPLPVGAAPATTQPQHSGPDLGDDPSVPTAPASDGAHETARKARGRPRRTSVPSWDEIVFGAKPE